MDIRQLEYFIEVVKTKSFTRASEQLYLTQPMLTKTIKQLEEELGVKLIERTSKSFRLTDAGKTFYDHALDVSLQFRDLHRIIADIKGVKTGEVNISIPAVLLSMYFPKLLLEFRTRFPEIQVNILEEGSKQAAQSVMNDAADMAVVMLPISTGQKMHTHTVVRDLCHVVVHRNHPFSACKEVHMGDLRDEKFIIFHSRFVLHDMILQSCLLHGFSPAIIYKSSLESFIFEMVSYQQGISILPYPLIQRYMPDDLVSIPLQPAIPWEIAFVTKKERYLSFAANALLEFAYTYFDRFESRSF